MIMRIWIICLLGSLWIMPKVKAQQLFNDDWEYSPDSVSWQRVQLPHDWSMRDRVDTPSPFRREAINGVSVGFTTGGTGWYRKTLDVSATQQDQVIRLLFEGVYMNCDVWLNDEHLGNHPYGYTSFWMGLTGKVKAGANRIIVRVKNEGKNSRWYAGSGIYRHVWLYVTDPVHIPAWGTAVVTKTDEKLAITTDIQNQSGKKAAVRLISRLLDAGGAEKARSVMQREIDAGSTARFERTLTVHNARRWSVDDPYRYRLVEEVYSDGKLVHSKQTPVGIRTIAVDAKRGFLLNGKPLKLKGGCIHHDHGPLGAMAFDRAEQRRVQLLKQSGFNAVRSSHNPPSPAFLNACDSLGLMVIDEAFDMWTHKKNQQDYHLWFPEWWKKDIESMVLRDRNHPSVIMWSTGNEIPKRETPEVVKTAQMLRDHILSIDSTRPVTCGVNGVAPDKDPFFSTLDVAGYNYAREKYEEDHARLPERVMMATESFPLDAFDYWMSVRDHDYVIGDFVWTAVDYIGESGIGWLGFPAGRHFFPWNLAYCGDIDICGWKRPQSFYRDALWMEDQLSLFVSSPRPSFTQTNPKLEPWSRWNWPDVVASWNWPGYEDSLLEVVAYASCEETELFQNGKSLGRKSTNRDTKYQATWKVPYRPGELKAVGYTNGKKVKESVLRTAGNVTTIKLSAARTALISGGQDLGFVTVELCDANGTLHPAAEDLVEFTIDGPAMIAGVGNANPVSLESFQLPRRKAWRGKCLVILRTTGETGPIKLTASVKGIQTASLKLESK